MIEYRKEVDGLRAFAVSPVIVNHAFPNLLPGGFIGVDVFFVISGYLITSILIEQIYSDRFSLLDFYDRRARRILPALMVVLLFTTVMSWIFLPNEELRDYFKSVSGAALFYSNFVFLDQIDYFGTDSAYKPLLHTWSLAVEEQFYIIFPLMLLVGLRIFRNQLWMFVLFFAVVSFLLSVTLTNVNPNASFYLLHTRFWELAIGAIIAIGFGQRDLNGPDWLGWLGIFLIVLSSVFISSKYPFPGAIALIPTLGAAFVLIGARNGNSSARFLSFRIFVGLGLVSYSAYLWHHPLLVFGRRLFLQEMPNLVTLSIIVLSIACAYLSWKFIEQPFRNKGILKRNQVLLGSVFVLGCLALFSNVAAYGQFGDNRTTMAGHTTKWLEDIQKANFGLDRNCNHLEEIQSGKCSIGRESEYILWGDSYAMHLAQAITAGGDPFTQLTMSACHPIIGMAPFSPVSGRTWGDLEWGNRCQDYNDMALNYILENQTEKIIISSPFGSLTDTDVSLNVRGNLLETEVARPTDAFLATLNMLLRNDKQVVIVSPMPRPPYAVADCIIRSSFLGKSFTLAKKEKFRYNTVTISGGC